MQGPARRGLGRGLWVAATIIYPLLQLWVVSAWPVAYDVWNHTVSDLGYTTCGDEDRPGGYLESCSPRHLTYNVGCALISVAIGAGALLLRRWWEGGVLGHLITSLFLVVAAAGVAVCVVPGDVSITWHSLLAIPVFLGQIAVLVLLAVRLRRRSPLLAALAAAVAFVSIAGMVGLVLALGGTGPVGLTERLAAETFYVWLLVAGLVGVREGRHGPHPSPSPRHPSTRSGSSRGARADDPGGMPTGPG